MMNDMKAVSAAVTEMDIQLRQNLTSPKMLWENTFIKHQLDKRTEGGTFGLSDHIRAMVYSMLSSGITWKRVESMTDLETGRIIPLDDLFCEYDPDYVSGCDPTELSAEIKGLRLASQYTENQMKALITVNIPKLKAIEKEYGSIDTLYKKYIIDGDISCLVWKLSAADSKMKYAQMGEALVAEYLKNVGYDTSKPDRHIRRILGSNHLACSDSKIVPIFEAFDIVADIAKESGKPTAEVDYILWSYCASGYGEICTQKNPKCDLCKAKELCALHSKR